MRHTLFFLFLLVSNTITAQYTLIPDINFEKALIYLGIDNGIPDGKVLTNSINSLKVLDLSLYNNNYANSYKINDLTGIEDFVELESLNCSQNQLTNIDISKNINLKYFHCYFNKLTNLDISKNIMLIEIFCSTNKLTHLDISKNVNLKWLNCYNNLLTYLNLKNGNNLNFIYNTANPYLQCDFKANPNLTCIYVDDPIYSNTNWSFIKDPSANYTNSEIPSPIITSPQTFCLGQTLKDIMTTSGINIKWYDTPTTGNTLLNNTLLENDKTYYASQTINGCESSRIPVSINIQNIIAPTYSVIQPTCSTNGTITITTLASQYSFDNGITFINSNSRSNLSPGEYLIKVKNSDGCISDPASVTISATPTFKIQSSGSVQTSCAGEFTSGIEMFIDTPASAYSFDNGITWSTTPYMNNLKENTEYCLRIKNSEGCISEPSCTKTIQQIPVPNAPLVSINQPINCSSTGTITVTTLKAEYSFDDGLTWNTNPTSKPLLPGTYFIRTREFRSSCVSYATTSIINAPQDVPESPNLNITQPISCVNPYGTIHITSSAFQYSFDNGLTYSDNPNSGLLAAGIYQIKIKNSAGCESEPVTIKINTPSDSPNIPVYSITQPDCYNSKGIITITTAASEYSFNNGLLWSTSAISTFLNPGEYFLKIKNADGCISDVNKAIIIPFVSSIPKPIINSSPQIFCIQQNKDLNSIAIIGQNIKWYDALTNGNLLINTTLLQDGITYYASQTINGCESERVPVVVNIQNTLAPTAKASQSFCTSQNPILSSISVTGTAVKWYDNLNAGNLLADTTPLQNGQTYYASQIVNNCESPIRTAVTVSLISSLPAQNYEELFCDDLNDGTETVDLNNYKSNIISNNTNYNFSYYTSLSGAQNETASNEISNFSNYKLALGENKIYVRINSNTSCYGVAELKLTLLSKPKITIEDIVPICENKTITIDAGAGFDSYLWSNGEITQTITVSSPGIFSVTVTDNYSTITCSNTKNFTVKESNKAVINSIETKDWTDTENVITVFVTGTGDYEYSIDGFNYQDSNIFTRLTNGEYTVQVRDKNGCGIVKSEEIYLLMFPKFFTPNGDRHNDTWKIKLSDFEEGLNIKIYDRYGKLIKTLAHNTSEWDGTFNGIALPASDYWFVVTRANGKEHKGHFSLKR